MMMGNLRKKWYKKYLDSRVCVKCGKRLDKNNYHKGFCKECAPEIVKYTISYDTKEYNDVILMTLDDLECKHVAQADEGNRDIVMDSINAGYPNIQWGIYRGVDIRREVDTISKMISDNFYKAIRITITGNHVWCDNTHTCISYMKRLGNVRVKDVPYYICDLRGDIPVVVGEKDILENDMGSIEGAIYNAMRLKFYEKNGGRQRCWRMSDLVKQIREVCGETP